ncbi:hypothetical protein GDO81_025943, partial [Engystomops pustulosus]
MLLLNIITISGILLNSFIVAVYIQDWRRHRAVVMCDQITFIMSFINVLLQLSLFMDGMFLLFGLYSQLPKEFFLCFLVLIFFLIDVGFWHTTWLAISYFTRLVHVSHPIFTRLKSYFPCSALPLLLGSATGSFLINIPYFFTTHFIIKEFASNESDIAMYSTEFHSSSILLHLVFGCCLPLSLTLICIGLCVRSLLSHVWRMRHNRGQYSSSPQLQALVQAAGTMILRVLLELAFSLCMTSLIATSFKMDQKTSLILWFLVVSCPTAQSIVLIMGSPRLKSRIL